LDFAVISEDFHRVILDKSSHEKAHRSRRGNNCVFTREDGLPRLGSINRNLGALLQMARKFTRVACCFAVSILMLMPGIQVLGATVTSEALTKSPQAAIAKAKEWFYRFRSGSVDRSQLDAECNLELTTKRVSEIAASLKAYNTPTAVTFVGTSPAGGAVGYNFILQFSNGRVIEAIAIDRSGAIAGFDFQTFVR